MNMIYKHPTIVTPRFPRKWFVGCGVYRKSNNLQTSPFKARTDSPARCRLRRRTGEPRLEFRNISTKTLSISTPKKWFRQKNTHNSVTSSAADSTCPVVTGTGRGRDRTGQCRGRHLCKFNLDIFFQILYVLWKNHCKMRAQSVT